MCAAAGVRMCMCVCVFISGKETEERERVVCVFTGTLFATILAFFSKLYVL